MSDVPIEDIYRSLWWRFRQYQYHIENTYFFNWESDFFCMSKSDYMYEFEIKLSYSDFKADFNKKEKHIKLQADGLYIKRGYPQTSSFVERKGYTNKSWHFEKDEEQSEERGFNVNKTVRNAIEVVNPNKGRPHKFIYVCPEGLIPVEEVPEYAGLMYYSPHPRLKHGKLKYIKEPPFIHKDKRDEEKVRKLLLHKIYWSYRSLREYKLGLR